VHKLNSENYEYILSVLDKAENGPIVEEKAWDRQLISGKVKELVKKYDISWPADVLVPSDDFLADRLFEAGLELARESGAYCLDTHRRMVWSRDELDGTFQRAPSQLTVGEGADARSISHRRPEEAARVAIIGGAYGTLIPEEHFSAMVTAYAKEPLFDLIEPPSLETAYGRNVRIDSPWEAVVARRESELALEAVRRAGRPGLCVGAAATSGTELIELAATTYGLARQTDWHHASFVSENKVSYADLTRAVHFANTGSIVHAFCDPIYGGYLGGAAGTAVGFVAGNLLLRAALFGDTVNAGPAHAMLSCDTHPDMIALQALGLQALTRNTHLLTSGHIRPAAGPCVPDLLYEVAALALAAVTSGAAFLKTVQSATGRHKSHTTPLEARFCAQVAHAAEGMPRREADAIVKQLAGKYRDGLKAGQIGKPFHEAYDLETLEPSPEWQRIYADVCAEMERDFGLKLRADVSGRKEP
jgi:methylamine--corrinoid protein Co-methyltransferase